MAGPHPYVAKGDSLVARNMPRLLADGVSYQDIIRVGSKTDNMEDWCQNWMAVAMEYQQEAERALREGNKITAGGAFWRAAIYNHFGQFHEFHDLTLKNEAAKRKVENYKKAAPLFTYPAERVEIPFEGIIMPGYLRMPMGVKKPPLIMQVGALEGTKENFNLNQNLFLERGLATLIYDGPGQGEVYGKMKARVDFEKSASAVIDYIQTRDDLDNERIGLLGLSLGGYYAPRCAATDKRIKACIAGATLYDLSAWDKMSDIHKDGFTYISGKKNWDEAKEFYKNWTLKGLAEKITCPLYFTQGKLDDVCPAEHIYLVAREAKGPTTIDMWEEGTHCADNFWPLNRPRYADWAKTTLSN